MKRKIFVLLTAAAAALVCLGCYRLGLERAPMPELVTEETASAAESTEPATSGDDYVALPEIGITEPKKKLTLTSDSYPVYTEGAKTNIRHYDYVMYIDSYTAFRDVIENRLYQIPGLLMEDYDRSSHTEAWYVDMERGDVLYIRKGSTLLRYGYRCIDLPNTASGCLELNIIRDRPEGELIAVQAEGPYLCYENECSYTVIDGSTGIVSGTVYKDRYYYGGNGLPVYAAMYSDEIYPLFEHREENGIYGYYPIPEHWLILGSSLDPVQLEDPYSTPDLPFMEPIPHPSG